MSMSDFHDRGAGSRVCGSRPRSKLAIRTFARGTLASGTLALGVLASGKLAVGVLAAVTPERTAAQPAPPQGHHAVVGVTVLTMEHASDVRGDQTVVIEGGRIVAMGPRETTPVPEGAEVIDGRGRWLLPGLAEMHAHVPSGQNPPRELVEETLFLYVANGITTIRGMLGAPYQLAVRDEIARGELLGPRFFVGAPSMSAQTAPTPEAAELRVRALAADGYDFLKIHPGIPLDAWNRMAEVAREVGISFSGHIPLDVGVDHAVATGISAIDHLDGFLERTRREDLRPDASPAERYAATDPERLAALMGRLAEARIPQIPTQYLWNHLNGYVDPDSMLGLPEFRYISAGQRMGYRNQANQRRENPLITPDSDAAHRVMRQDFLRAAHAAGVPILMGTDSPQLFNVPGFALHRELPLMVDAGMTPFEVLHSGTAQVSAFVQAVLGHPGDFGFVREGMRADLLLVDGDPLIDLGALQAPAGVFLEGRWLSGDAIRAGLEAIAAKYAGG
jgi:imidazolonepropionase-like amidohydrolase